MNKADGKLGFPKGKYNHEKDWTHKDTVCREWEEEAGLRPSPLIFHGPPIEDSAGILYYPCLWDAPMQAGPVADAFTRYKGGAAWDVLEYDDDPIVRAMWLPVEVALKERNFANQRKTILQPALNLFNSQNSLQQKSTTNSTPNSKRNP